MKTIQERDEKNYINRTLTILFKDGVEVSKNMG